MDRRTTEYRDASDRMAKARAARAAKRAREGEAAAAVMESARPASAGRRGFFAWLFGG